MACDDAVLSDPIKGKLPGASSPATYKRQNAHSIEEHIGLVHILQWMALGMAYSVRWAIGPNPFGVDPVFGKAIQLYHVPSISHKVGYLAPD